jgi:hypothetical protein
MFVDARKESGANSPNNTTKQFCFLFKYSFYSISVLFIIQVVTYRMKFITIHTRVFFKENLSLKCPYRWQADMQNEPSYSLFSGPGCCQKFSLHVFSHGFLHYLSRHILRIFSTWSLHRHSLQKLCKTCTGFVKN